MTDIELANAIAEWFEANDPGGYVHEVPGELENGTVLDGSWDLVALVQFIKRQIGSNL